MSIMIATDFVEGEEIVFQPKGLQVEYIPKRTPKTKTSKPKPVLSSIQSHINWEKAIHSSMYELVKISPKSVIIKADGKKRIIKRKLNNEGLEYGSFIFRGLITMIRPQEGKLWSNQEISTPCNRNDELTILYECGFFDKESEDTDNFY